MSEVEIWGTGLIPVTLNTEDFIEIAPQNAAEVGLCRHLQTESGAAGSWPQNSLLGAESRICLGVNRLCFGQILANPLFSYTNVKSNRK